MNLLLQPTDEEELAEDEGGTNAAECRRHLCRLAEMDALDSISVTASDFYGHLVFRWVLNLGVDRTS